MSASNKLMPIDIVMFGGDRAGKTSLLASMYANVKGEIPDVGLTIRRDGFGTIGLLDDALEVLNTLWDKAQKDPYLSSESSEVKRTAALGPATFTFILAGLERDGGERDVAQLRFHDFAGRDLRRQKDYTRKILDRADIFLIAINTPAMMLALDDRKVFDDLHTRSNLPEQLTHVLEHWGAETRPWAIAPPTLVMFCPIKCERWLDERADAQRLVDAVQKMYSAAISKLTKNFPQTTVVIAPVETVGSVIYDTWEIARPGSPPKSDNVRFRWKAEPIKARSPRYAEQPFWWAMMVAARQISFLTMLRTTEGSLLVRLRNPEFWAAIGGTLVGPLLPYLRFIRKMQDWNRDLEFRSELFRFKEGADLLSQRINKDLPFHILQEGTEPSPAKAWMALLEKTRDTGVWLVQETSKLGGALSRFFRGL